MDSSGNFVITISVLLNLSISSVMQEAGHVTHLTPVGELLYLRKQKRKENKYASWKTKFVVILFRGFQINVVGGLHNHIICIMLITLRWKLELTTILTTFTRQLTLRLRRSSFQND